MSEVSLMQARDHLVEATRDLVAAVGRTDVDPATMQLLTDQIKELVPTLQQKVGAGVPRASFEDAVGANEYTWQVHNPALPGIRMHFVEGQVRAQIAEGLNHLYEGPRGLVHGGVSAMLMDTVLTSAVQYRGFSGVTASLSLDYRRPTPLARPLVLVGRVEEIGPRKALASGELICDGVVTVEAHVLVIGGPKVSMCCSPYRLSVCRYSAPRPNR